VKLVRLAVATALLVIAVSVPTDAASFVIPSDGDLIDSADAIVIATVLSSNAEPNELIGIATVSDLAIERVLKGEGIRRDEPLHLTELGGMIGNRFVLVDGTPRFEVGQRALLFLERTPRGEWRTLQMIVGKFGAVTDPAGNRLLIREINSDVPAWNIEGKTHHEVARVEEKFVAFIESRVRGDNGTPDYFYPLQPAIAAQLRIGSMARIDYLLTSGSSGFRWLNPTANFRKSTGGVNGGNVPGLDEDTAIGSGMDMWNNDPNSSVGYGLIGTTPSTHPPCNPSPSCASGDGTNAVIFDDPHEIVSGSFGPTGGVLGVGIAWGIDVYSLDGENFVQIGEGDVVMNNGISSSNVQQATLTHALAHELGHTLGFRHSDQGTPSTTDAIMRSSIVDVFNNLRQYDRDAVSTVYGTGPACTPPSITTQPVNKSITSGQSTTLTVGATGSTPLSFQWFRGPSGNTSDPVGGATSATLNTGPLTTTTQFWARVTGQCAPVANSAAATVTVAACTPPSISVQPQDKSIASGTSTSLTVGVTGTGPFTFQWFRGTSGDTSSPVGGNSSTLNTGVLNTSASFWVRVSTACAPPADSVTATVTVTCLPPNITIPPQNGTVQSGQSTTLSVGLSGSPPFSHFWFLGNKPDESNLIGTGSTLPTGPLTATTNYWLRVTNACGAVESNTVTVTVAASCTAPAISAQPVSLQITEGSTATLSVTATGTSLNYQWFQGSPPGGTAIGSNSPTITVAPTATTNYYVRISNSCGNLNSAPATVTVVSAPTCAPGHLCLIDGRFKVALFARDPRSGNNGAGQPVPENDLFGYFSIPVLTGNPNNLEVFVKILDARTVNGSFWIFFGSLTDFEYTLIVTDQTTGQTEVYTKAPFESKGGFDVGAFTGAAFVPSAEACPGSQFGTPTQESAGTCIQNSNRLCLLDGRFRVTLSARDQRTGNTGSGQATRKATDFGHFSIPALTNQPQNPEVFVKMIDARGIGSGFWIFYAGLTDLEYTITVTDMTNGRGKRYVKPAGSACGGFDTSAFTP
jgi:hypothetical protein